MIQIKFGIKLMLENLILYFVDKIVCIRIIAIIIK